MPLEEELGNTWDLDRDPADPSDSVLPGPGEKTRQTQRMKSEGKCAGLTPGAVLQGPGQVVWSCGGREGAALFVLPPKEPSPLVSHQHAAAYPTDAVFASRGHCERRVDESLLL